MNRRFSQGLRVSAEANCGLGCRDVEVVESHGKPRLLFCQSSYKVYRKAFAQSDNSRLMNPASPGLDPSIEFGWPSEARSIVVSRQYRFLHKAGYTLHALVLRSDRDSALTSH
jgi:hypothetical protein